MACKIQEDYWFTAEQSAEYEQYFAENGFCVITKIIDSDRIDASIQEIWEHPALLGNHLDRTDPTTWDQWVTDDKGFLDVNGGHSPTELQYYWINRLDPKIINIFRTLYQEDVILQLDRAGFMRPTKNIKIGSGDESYLVDKPEWRTKAGWLHVDHNPWEGPDSKLHLQGLLTLTEQTETSGGFCCIPRFHQRVAQWSEDNLAEQEKFNGLYFFPPDCEEQTQIVKLNAPAGSLIVWNGMIPHCNYPNEDDTFRIVEYVKYLRKSQENESEVVRNFLQIGLDSQICSDSSYFPHQLTYEDKKLINLDKYCNLLTSPTQLKGYCVYKEACALETQGCCREEMEKAGKLYQKSFKMCPILEQL